MTKIDRLIKELLDRYLVDKNNYEKLIIVATSKIRDVNIAKGKMYSSRDAWKTSVKYK